MDEITSIQHYSIGSFQKIIPTSYSILFLNKLLELFKNIFILSVYIFDSILI